MADMTPEQFRQYMRRLLAAIKEARGVAELTGIKTLEGLMKRRIFNQGLASDATPLGNYSRAYSQKRRLAGRQIGYKDLEFTGALRRSLVTGTSKGAAVLGFINDRGRIIAEGQEQQVGRAIWRPTDAELDAMVKAMLRSVERTIKKAI